MNVSDNSLSPTNVLFDPTATRLEMVPEEAVIQAIEECKRLARKAALLAHPECDDAIVEITGMERRPGFCHVDVNVRMVPPPKVYLNVKITSEIKHEEDQET
jgi:hypothetical protein